MRAGLNSKAIDQDRCRLLPTAAMSSAAAGAAIAVVLVGLGGSAMSAQDKYTLAITSSALARQPTTHLKGFYAPAAAPNSRSTVDRNDPALTGGGSLGYNQRVEQGF
jgi:hypothetical protein